MVEYFDYDKNGIIDKKNEVESLYETLNIDQRFIHPENGLSGLELLAYNVLVKEGKIKPIDYNENKN
ncbi:MAG: hypothetical protein Q8Q04_02520 [archaeon]|nr:hypothetical protein [archaeon]